MKTPPYSQINMVYGNIFRIWYKSVHIQITDRFIGKERYSCLGDHALCIQVRDRVWFVRLYGEIIP